MGTESGLAVQDRICAPWVHDDQHQIGRGGTELPVNASLVELVHCRCAPFFTIHLFAFAANERTASAVATPAGDLLDTGKDQQTIRLVEGALQQFAVAEDFLQNSGGVRQTICFFALRKERRSYWQCQTECQCGKFASS